MGLPRSGDVASRFSAFIDGLMSVIGHAARAKPLRDYCTGLMMPCDRKSVEPMAAITAPDRTAAQHQSLLHFVGQGDWSDRQVLAKVREMVLPEIERHGPIEAWIIDDTGFPKKGRHSVGVGRQYCGELGKQDNCQIAVTLSIANHHASLPVAYRLYLPKEWAADRARRRKTGVPKEVTFKTKPAIALEQLRWACAAGLPRGVALMDIFLCEPTPAPPANVDFSIVNDVSNPKLRTAPSPRRPWVTMMRFSPVSGTTSATVAIAASLRKDSLTRRTLSAGQPMCGKSAWISLNATTQRSELKWLQKR